MGRDGRGPEPETDNMTKYIQIERIPSVLRFDVPPQNQGQIIEVAYADERPYRSEACSGARYKRVTDRSTGKVSHYTLAPEANDAAGWDRLSRANGHT